MPAERPLAALLLFGALWLMACGSGDAADGGGDDDGLPEQETATATLDPTTAPVLDMPASRFSLLLEDLPPGYLTDGESTFHLTSENYGATPIFTSPGEGKAMLESWGYLGGFETAFQPEQKMNAVLNGGFYAAVEIHLFKDEEGAAKAQSYFEERLSHGSHRVSSAEVGNRSSAWTLTEGTVPGSSIGATYHQIVFRRGSMVGVVQTYGSEMFMTIDTALTLATYVDQKALGVRPAVEPTPLSGTTAPTPGQ